MGCTSEKVVSSTEVQCDPPSPELMKGKTDKNGNAEVVVSKLLCTNVLDTLTLYLLFVSY